MLETIKTDPACKGLTPVYQSISNLSDQFAFLDEGLEDEDKKDLNRYIKNLKATLALETDVTVQLTLATALGEAEVEAMRRSLDQERKEYVLRGRAARYLTEYMEVLSESYPDQALCFEKNQGLPFQLAGHLVSLSGGFYGPTANLAITLAGRMFSSFISYVQNRKIVKKIKTFRNSKMPAALTCAVEALEQTVCDIQDQRSLIKQHEKSREDPVKIAEEWRGYHLLLREYPIVKKFLNEVEAGTKASSLFQGIKQSDFRKNEGNFKATLATMNGLVGEVERKLEQIPDSDIAARRRNVRTLIDNLSGTMLAKDNNIHRAVLPTSEAFTRTVLWLMLGTPSPPLPDKFRTYSEYLTSLDASETEIKLSTVVANLEIINEAARNQLQVERKLTLNPDAQGVLAGFVDKGINRHSPEQVMMQIVDYFEDLQSIWKLNPQWFSSKVAQREQLKLSINTKEMFQKTLDTLQEDSLEYEEKTIQVFKLMSLEEQDQVVTGRLRRIVGMDLQKRMEQGLLVSEEKLDIVTRIATDDLINALTPTRASGLEKLKPALRRANQLAKANLINFFDTFEEPLEESFEMLNKQASRLREGPLGDTMRVKSELCMLMLNDPDVPKDIRKQCITAVLGQDDDGNFAKDGNGNEIRIAFAEEVYKAPEDRFCAYRRFQNKLELNELLRQRPKLR
jgi:hypothetical protein